MTTTTMKGRRQGDLPVGTMILLLLVLVGGIAAYIRFSQGLGAATNLYDGLPWGLWIGLDVMSGVALAAGGFTLAGAVYIFRLKRFYPLIRPTILTAYLGYILAAGSIIFDLGRPERFYHPFFYWNTHSVMFEIAWSVLSYLVILTLENSTLVAERFHLRWLLRLSRTILIPVVILGIVISTMHQSSLGGLFLLAPQRLHPLWFTPLLPVLFYISAIMVGLAMVIIESSLSASAFGRKLELNLLSEIGSWIPWVLGLYFLLKVGILLFAGKLGELFQFDTAGILFWLEMLVGVIIPFALLVQPRLQKNRYWLFRAALMIAVGVVLNRFNVMFFGQWGAIYAPTWIEFAVTAGLISLGVLIYMFTVKNFPVLGQEAH